MDFLQQWMRILYFVLLGCISRIPCVNSYISLQRNSMFSPTPPPQYRNNIYVHPTETPIVPAVVSTISSAYPRQFFNILPNRRTFTPILVRPVNIQNAIKSPQSTLYQKFTRLNPMNQAKLFSVLRNQMGTSSNLPVVKPTTHPSRTSLLASNMNSMSSSQPFTLTPNTKDMITREVEQNAVLLQRLVGQNQMGSSTASRLGRQVSQMKQKLLALEPPEQQQQESFLMKLRQQFQNQLALLKQPDVNTEVSSAHTPPSTGTVSSTALMDVPHSSPIESIDDVFANMAAESGKSISFSSDVGPGIYKVEYDMLITQKEMEEKYSPKHDQTRTKRALVRDIDTHWTGGRIPYTMRTSDFSSSEARVIHLALREWESYTCVNFVPATPTDTYSIHLKDSDGCHSYVGMKRKNQMVGLAKPCRKRSIILHEIGHAIGMFHEQARPDRNTYIDIMYNNILPPVRFNFQPIDADKTTNYSIPYDYLSVMHYGETAFSFNRSAITMKAKDHSFQKKMGKATRISFRDVMSVNAMYNCSGHCTSRPHCPFKEAFVGKDCRCWCPTDADDREPAKLCPTVPTMAPPRGSDTTQTSNRRSRPGQTQQDTNRVRLQIAFNPNRRQTTSGAANALLTPVGEGHNFIRNPSNQGAPMVPTSGNGGSQTLAGTLSNLPDSIRVRSRNGNGRRLSGNIIRNSQSSNRATDRSNFRSRQSIRSQRPSTTPSGDRLEQQLVEELRKLNGANSGSVSHPSESTPLLSGLTPPGQSNGDMDTLVNNVMGLLSSRDRQGHTNQNANGAVVSSHIPGGGVATADLKMLLQELNRLNNQNQMSPQMPSFSNVRHTHVRSRARNADILIQRRTQSLLRELSDFLVPRTGRRQQRPTLTADQMGYILQKLPSFNSPSTSVTHTHPVDVQSGHHTHHHNHNPQHRQNGVLSPIIENSYFHSNP